MTKAQPQTVNSGREAPASRQGSRPARKALRALVFVLVALCVVAADQLSKHFMRVTLADGARRVLIPHVLDLYLVQNTGAAFSLGEGMGWVFVLIALAISMAAFVFVLRDKPSWPLTCTLAAVVGGGIGNMVDRVRFGAVTDFLATSFIEFPVFNVADIFVTCGVVLVFMLMLGSDKESDA